MKIRLLAASLLLVGLTACQSHSAAMEIVCNASTACPDCNDADPSLRAMHLAEYISTNVSNAETVQMFSALANVDPSTRARIIREEATRAGLASCPMADEWDVGASQPPAPPAGQL